VDSLGDHTEVIMMMKKMTVSPGMYVRMSLIGLCTVMGLYWGEYGLLGYVPLWAMLGNIVVGTLVATWWVRWAMRKRARESGLP
jgi:formate/nitrite transporter FocA (FNT family)